MVGESAERCVAALDILAAKIQNHSYHTESQRLNDILLQGEPPSTAITQEGSGQVEHFDAISVPLDLEGMDFDVGDMLWLNASAADILF